MKTYTICGSMRFEREMREIAWVLETQRGYNVLQCAYPPEGTCPAQAEQESLACAHRRKIDLSDGVYVVNIGGYTGESVRGEIEYAARQGKEIVYHCEV